VGTLRCGYLICVTNYVRTAGCVYKEVIAPPHTWTASPPLRVRPSSPTLSRNEGPVTVSGGHRALKGSSRIGVSAQPVGESEVGYAELNGLPSYLRVPLRIQDSFFCNKMQKMKAVQWFTPPRGNLPATQGSHKATIRHVRGPYPFVPTTVRQLLPHPWAHGEAFLYFVSILSTASLFRPASAPVAHGRLQLLHVVTSSAATHQSAYRCSIVVRRFLAVVITWPMERSYIACYQNKSRRSNYSALSWSED